ncbi:MAG: O-antigen ligase family protein [Lachnospiraceae bacterium]|nr:O-antigen ligase family protein [Lachnospiraceae bacterium]
MNDAVKYYSLISDKRRRIGNVSLLAGLFFITTACFHFFSWYTVMAPYGTLISAVFLIITLFCYVDLSYMLKDPAFYLMAAGDMIALVNLFLIGSDKGAILTVADLLLVLYLSNKVVLNDREMAVSAFYTGIFFIYWTIDVKGYFKGYNTNYGGLVLISGFFFLIFFIEYIAGKAKDKRQYICIRIFELIMVIVAFKIISWYRSRCALVGLITFLFIYIMPKKIWKNKVIYAILCFLGTLGSVAFSAFYVWLGRMKEVFSFQIFYKDIISGRDELWGVLWDAYLKKPFTGIGSSYEINLEWLNGMFEVHSGLLDILMVHGLVVFIITMCFLLFRLFGIREMSGVDAVSKTAMAGIYGMLFTAFMENYVIVPPFLLMFLLLFTYINNRALSLSGQKEVSRDEGIEDTV